MVFDVTLSGKATRIAALQNLKNIYYVNQGWANSGPRAKCDPRAKCGPLQRCQ